MNGPRVIAMNYRRCHRQEGHMPLSRHQSRQLMVRRLTVVVRLPAIMAGGEGYTWSSSSSWDA